MAESYLQHAEHYFRLIASAQQAQQQSAYGYQRSAVEQMEADDDADDDDFASLPDRFASPAERIAPPPAPQPYIERPSYNGGDRQPYEPRQERYGQERQPAAERHPRQERGYQEPQSQPERYDTRSERYDNRVERAPPRPERQPYVERVFSERAPPPGPERGTPDRGNPERGAGNGQARDYDNRGHRNSNRAQRDFRGEPTPARESRESASRESPAREPAPRETTRETRQPDIESTVAALPAFITTPARVQPDIAPAAEPVVASAPEAAPAVPEIAGEDGGFAVRPRRRRRAKAEFPSVESDAPQAAPDPVET